MALCERRMSSSTIVLTIWESMITIRYQKQASNLQRITVFSKKARSDLTEEIIEEQLILMVIDNLLQKNKKATSVSKDNGTYLLPKKEFEKGSHDWYCFECHLSGKVLCCTTCHRVYHPSCVHGGTSKETDFVCSICKMIDSENNLKIEANDLKAILTFTCNRLKDKSSGHLHKIARNSNDAWQLNYLLYEYVDLVTMSVKLVAGQYKQLEEFQVDAMGIVHNAVIIYGASSQQVNVAKQMLELCVSELSEMRNCPNCYRMSNEKKDNFWFCQPCNPPHELVYAKQTGYPYWPAKVISKTETSYDVRFFGASHQRAIVSKAHVKPINCDTTVLGIKRSSSWKKACEQLARHQKLLCEAPVEISPDDDNNVSNESESPLSKREKLAEQQNDDMAIPVVVADEPGCQLELPQDEMMPSPRLEDENKKLPSTDCHNVVSSTQDSIIAGFVSTATQTIKPASLDNDSSKLVQTDVEKDEDEKIGRVQMASDTKISKDKTIKMVTTKLEKKHLEDKEKAVAIVQKELNKFQEDHQREMEKCQEDHQRELKAIHATFQKQLTETKKKQWCYTCEREAVYHCCWNTSYCSIECQQAHWQKEHKRNCRRKRNQHSTTN